MSESWQVFHNRSLVLFLALACRSQCVAEQRGVQLLIHALNYWTELSGMLVIKLAVFWTVTLPIDNLWYVIHAI